MNNKVKIKVLSDSNYFIKYLINNSIKYESLYRKDIYYYLDVSIDDYKRIKYRYETTIIRYYGINYIKNFISYNKYFIISFFICLFLLNILCNTIYQIDINTSNIELKNSIKDVLNKYDISINKRKVNRDKLNIIKDNILKEIPNIEWIEINEIGTKYIVDITEKVISNNDVDNSPSDIIASKDGLIKHIVIYNGTKIKEENEYVRKDEVIISGGLYKDETLINYENAEGEVYAETWYLSKITIPFEYTFLESTGKKINHYYVELFNKKFTILGYYNKENMVISESCILDKPYLIFKIYKESMTEYKNKTILLSEKEAFDIAINKSNENIKKTLNDDEYIISKNILKKEVNSSKMYLEVFYKVYENIASKKEVIIEE